MTSFFVALAFICQVGVGCFPDVYKDQAFKTEADCVEFNKAQVQEWANTRGVQGTGVKVFTTCVRINEPKDLPPPTTGV